MSTIQRPSGAVGIHDDGMRTTILGGHGDGAHPLPSRTGKLSPSAPMVLLYQVGE